MTKLKPLIRGSIHTLLRLCSDIKTGDTESSTIFTPEGTIHKKKGYSKEISSLTYEILDRDISIKRYCSTEFLKDDID